jgi:CO dehydrogenase maturation factor
MTKQQFLEYKIQTSLVETPGFDLIAMGRPEGPGCYCYANNLLRDILRTLSANYQYVLIDNQAGMEHLSRRTAHNIDYLLIISNPSVRGVRSAAKISRLIKELDARIQEKYLILNRIQNSIPQQVKNIIEEEGLKLFQSIPEDEKLLEMDQNGKPIVHITTDSPAYQAIDELLMKLLNLEKDEQAKE